MTNLESLTIQNRLIFAHVMSKEENCLPLLKMLFPHLNILRIEYVEAEKTVEDTLVSKGVRFDVYVKDVEGRAFTLEMQVENTRSLPRRSRYYSSMMDVDLLQKSESYDALAPAYVVFICPFDLFGKGLHRYTFRNTCLEDGTIELGDRSEKIFLNAKGTADDVPEELKDFLEYVAGSYEGKDAYVEKLNLAVQDARQSISRKRGYMNYIDEMKHERYEGREEGREEGRAEERGNTERERKRAEEAEAQLQQTREYVESLEKELKALRG
ncbi:MAG: Rpn family recombination-promoting nuclease/putative transposase [Lachnospiraceae bacterium]|nr:Rpn family recombination-promoting nuclease/putative transposase [Lachnospiraceae bacterium]